MLFGFQALDQDVGVCSAEIARTAIPGQRGAPIAAHPGQVSVVEKNRVEGLPQPDRGLPVSRIGGVFVKKPRGREITLAEKNITARYERSDLRRR